MAEEAFEGAEKMELWVVAHLIIVCAAQTIYLLSL